MSSNLDCFKHPVVLLFEQSSQMLTTAPFTSLSTYNTQSSGVIKRTMQIQRTMESQIKFPKVKVNLGPA